MNCDRETILSTIPGSSTDEQLVVVMCRSVERDSYIEIRQQSWGEGIGWFTQSTVKMEPHQVGQLRNTLGHTPANSRPPAFKLPPRFNTVAPDGFTPRIVWADSA